MGNRNSRPVTIQCPTAAAFLSPLGAREILDAISANFGRLSPGGSLIIDLENVRHRDGFETGSGAECRAGLRIGKGARRELDLGALES